jgi:hypothetical protein
MFSDTGIQQLPGAIDVASAHGGHDLGGTGRLNRGSDLPSSISTFPADYDDMMTSSIRATRISRVTSPG